MLIAMGKREFVLFDLTKGRALFLMIRLRTHPEYTNRPQGLHQPFYASCIVNACSLSCLHDSALSKQTFLHIDVCDVFLHQVYQAIPRSKGKLVAVGCERGMQLPFHKEAKKEVCIVA